MIVTATAPGKLILIGEYAVLDGAPAMALAVDRRAEVQLRPGAGDSWAIDAPGIIAKAARFRLLRDGTLDWQGVGGMVINRLRPIAQVLCDLMSQGPFSVAQVPGFTATLLTLNFFYKTQNGGRDKLGLGSSAALTVALAFALAEYAGFPLERLSRENWLSMLTRAHRSMQGGRGSGLDIATSLWGGVIRYSLRSGAPEVRSMAIPDDLSLLFIWTGRGASTNTFLTAFRDWRDAKVEQSARIIDDLGQLSSLGIDAAENRDSQMLLETVAAYGAALRRLGRASRIDIYSAEHERIAGLADTVGAVYKPCGAGGGDLGVALSNDPDVLTRLAADVESAGFRTVALQIDPRGVQTNRRT